MNNGIQNSIHPANYSATSHHNLNMMKDDQVYIVHPDQSLSSASQELRYRGLDSLSHRKRKKEKGQTIMLSFS